MTEQNETWWNAVVGWQTPDPLDEDHDALDLIFDHLQDHHGVMSRHPVDGTWEVRVSLQAPDLDTAYRRAVEIMMAATGETPVAIEVLREDLFDQRLPYIQPMVKPTA